MITKEQVIEAQHEWGAGVVKIGSLKDNRSECESFTSDFLDKLYSFEDGPVLFKPTKCELEQFRPTKAEAKSYFIAGDDRACNEDKGFAINPWTKVRFENSDIILAHKILFRVTKTYGLMFSYELVKILLYFNYTSTNELHCKNKRRLQ